MNTRSKVTLKNTKDQNADIKKQSTLNKKINTRQDEIIKQEE